MALVFADILVDLTSSGRLSVLDPGILPKDYCQIDLSRVVTSNIPNDLTIPEECQAYISSEIQKSGRKVAFGGYLEDRLIYHTPQFHEAGEPVRSIHLGVDFWCEAGTSVFVPVDGIIHSFRDNRDPGNYGPTIILSHSTHDTGWYSLYGHLSRASLLGLEIGQFMTAGSVLGQIGTIVENGGYAPHLHFQLVQDLQGMVGDYPGVCALKDLEFYQNNCPDPNLLLRI